MAQTASDTDLAGRLLQLESAVRALQAAAAVGGTTVTASDAADNTITGTASTVGGDGWFFTGPAVDLFVANGRIEVKVAATLEVYGNRCSMFVGYRVKGPVDAQEELDDADTYQEPDYDRAIQLQDDGAGMNQLGAFGTFDLVEGLEVAWYRVTLAYALSYSSTTGAPYGIASARRLSVTRY
jgi:hypothetical protein